MALKDRICLCCGKTYQYCPSCKGYDPEKTWMFLVHDEKCLDVYNIWQQYRGKEIDKDTAAKALKALDVTEILKSGSPVVPVLKEILDIKDEVKEEIAEEKEVEKNEEPVETKAPITEQPKEHKEFKKSSDNKSFQKFNKK